LNWSFSAVSDALPPPVLDQLFRKARSRNDWVEESLPQSVWHELYELMKFGPTTANTNPARFVFVTTPQGKARMAPYLSEANRTKSLKAAAIVIIGHDLNFAEKVPQLFPHNPGAKDWFRDPKMAETTAFRSGTLQGAYLMLAARALGLDAGPMSGFDNAGVDKEFFAATQIKSNFICALGHGADESFPRLPRLSFDEACRIV
jgi:3-hydroxypropanoate dehydrogenase